MNSDYIDDLEKRIEELENKINYLSGNKYLVLGKIKDGVDSSTDQDWWVVKGFFSLKSSQKFIDRLYLDLIDAKDYIDAEKENNTDDEVYEENGKLIDRFFRKYGQNVFGNLDVMLNCDTFVYRVQQIPFENNEDIASENKPITKTYSRED